MPILAYLSPCRPRAFALSIGSGFVKAPLKMELADGLNKKKSMFDVTVRKFFNNQFILGKKAPYGGAMLLYFLSVGAKGNSSKHKMKQGKNSWAFTRVGG